MEYFRFTTSDVVVSKDAKCAICNFKFTKNCKINSMRNGINDDDDIILFCCECYSEILDDIDEKVQKHKNLRREDVR